MAEVIGSVTPRLKFWNVDEKFSTVHKAVISNDGRFIALNANNENVLVVIYCKHLQEDVLVSEAKE